MPVVSAQIRRALTAALALTAIVVALFVATDRAAAAPKTTKCPNTFRVLHNDHIGKLSLRAGTYVISVINPNKLSCGHASKLFTKFLQDYDGKLPGDWKVKVRRSGFQKSRTVGFFVKRRSGTGGGGGGGGRHPAPGEKICPGTFQVQHNDHIGRLRLPAGPYKITVLHKRRMSCQRASDLFARFLQKPDGNLPNRWKLEVQSATFTKKGTRQGFRVKQA
jgi:hypothetical protein